jgi:hypothetical protein
MLVIEGRFLAQASRKLQAKFMLAGIHQDPLGLDRDVNRNHS